ncbi:hypothetical protein AB0C51_06465 [Streptomyces pathocidini]|uniref:hypothetical protein n=1 Tax=Streptomyces pathocidini TaxID=1650571 RepID=UPI0033C26D26
MDARPYQHQAEGPEHPLALSLTTHGTTAAVAVLTDAAHRNLGRPHRRRHRRLGHTRNGRRVREEALALRREARPGRRSVDP